MSMIPSSEPVHLAGWEFLSWSFSASRVRDSNIYMGRKFPEDGRKTDAGESNIDICVCMSAQTHTQIQEINKI